MWFFFWNLPSVKGNLFTFRNINIFVKWIFSYIGSIKNGNYREDDALLPVNNYAWSKLGGECAVQMYKNSLILRLCITEKPFTHKVAFYDAIASFMFHEDLVKILPKLIKKRGIINVGGPSQSIFSFAKKSI